MSIQCPTAGCNTILFDVGSPTGTSGSTSPSNFDSFGSQRYGDGAGGMETASSPNPNALVVFSAVGWVAGRASGM